MKTRFNRREFGLDALAASTALASAGRPVRAQTAPVKIRVGWVVVPASLAPLVLEKKDILKHYGQSYVAEATRFEGTPPVITALASGELDIGPLAFSSFGLAIQNAHMDDLRVISDEIQDGVAGHGSNEFMVLKDGPVKTVADLKGKEESRGSRRHRRPAEQGAAGAHGVGVRRARSISRSERHAERRRAAEQPATAKAG